jgi:hypothetical protein
MEARDLSGVSVALTTQTPDISPQLRVDQALLAFGYGAAGVG